MQSTWIEKLVVFHVDVIIVHIGKNSLIYSLILHSEVDLVQHRLGQLETGKCYLEVGPS